MSKAEFLNVQLRQAFERAIALRTGLVVREQDTASFTKKIFQRIKALKLSLPEDYYRFLQTNTITSEREWQNLILLLTNNESYFFRDKEQFNLLRNQILPELVKRKQANKNIRICSAGCSTGQEPYSLAIILQELLPDFRQWNLLILGIDIDETALKEAEKGIYDSWSFRGVNEIVKQQYFQIINKQYYLNQEIKRLVKFQKVNLVLDSFPQQNSELRNMDLIICRNVFIYFETSAIAKVLDKIYHTLNPLGYFLAGHTELSGHNLSKYQTKVFPESLVYQRRADDVNDKESSSTSKTSEQLLTPNPYLLNTESHENIILKFSQQNELEKITEKIPTQPTDSEMIREAETLWKQDKPNLAIERIDKIIQIYPNSFQAYYLMAQIYANLGKYQEASNYCDRALQINPFAVSPHYLLVQIAEEQGNLEQAKQILKKIIYLDSSFVVAYLDLSHIYQQEGDKQRSIKMQETALNILKKLPPNTRIKERENLTVAELIELLQKL